MCELISFRGAADRSGQCVILRDEDRCIFARTHRDNRCPSIDESEFLDGLCSSDLDSLRFSHGPVD